MSTAFVLLSLSDIACQHIEFRFASKNSSDDNDDDEDDHKFPPSGDDSDDYDLKRRNDYSEGFTTNDDSED